MPLIWFVQGRDTLQHCLIHSATLNYCKRVHVCNSMSEWLDFYHEMTMNNQEDWCNDKINQDLIHGTISLHTTAVIPKISLFQWTRHYKEPQLEFFPLFSPAWLKWATGVMRIVWLTLTSKKTPGRCQKLHEHKDHMKGTELLKVNKLAVGFLCCP